MLEPAQPDIGAGWPDAGTLCGPSAEPGPVANAEWVVEGGAAAPARGRRHRLNRRRQYSLLVVRGDGVRVVRFNFPHPLVVAVATVLVAAVSMVGLLVGDWVQLRELTREALTFQQQINEQRLAIDSFNRRVAGLRGEMAGWRHLHTRIWEPFGPELAPGGKDKSGGKDRSIGGGIAREERPPAPLSPSEELERLAAEVRAEGESLRALDRLISRAGKALAALPSRWPVRGAVNSEFGNRLSPWTTAREFHGGIDIRAALGTPVHAPAAGTVTFTGTQTDFGVTVVLDHGQDIRTLYGHLSKPAVKIGQQVERGMLLGYTGNTGRSSGPHLHYEILVKGQSVNPRAYLWD